MACDIYTSLTARALLTGKNIVFFGDSNTRAIYKDLTWLLENGSLISTDNLKKKNELSHANDTRLSNGVLMNSRNYVEARRYQNDQTTIQFDFITRLNLPGFYETLNNLPVKPDVIIMNSTVWDVSRWGPNGVEKFKVNLRETMTHLKNNLPKDCQVIWNTTLPPSFTCKGGFLTEEIVFLRTLLPFHVVEANNYAASVMREFGFDLIDLHYHMRFLIEYRGEDGIHFKPASVRYITNILLTHFALSWNKRTPGNVPLDIVYLDRTITARRSNEERPQVDKPVHGRVTKRNKKKRNQNQRTIAEQLYGHNNQSVNNVQLYNSNQGNRKTRQFQNYK